MGILRYDGEVIEFDDRLLAHLQIVIMQKFRAGESFPMSWLDPVSIGNGRCAIWLTPTFPLHFKFAGSRAPAISREWLELLTRSAASGTGLIVCEENGDLAYSTAHRTYLEPRRAAR